MATFDAARALHRWARPNRLLALFDALVSRAAGFGTWLRRCPRPHWIRHVFVKRSKLHLCGEDGYSLIELVTVMAILGVVMGGLVAVFTAGINADASSNRRFQSQQDARVALDKLRRDAHGACTVSAPNSYNSPLSSVTFYFGSDNCVSGTHSITWCTSGSGTNYSLYRVVATSCTGLVNRFAEFLRSGTIFTYLPPNSHLMTATSLDQGTSATYIATQDGSNTLPRLHIDMTVNRTAKSNEAFHVVDDITLRNGPRACSVGVPSC
jgi:prepilin-type N-terminal cleavage/methylation domain-containing protein